MTNELLLITANDKTRQDKTRQDKTRQDKTRQDKFITVTSIMYNIMINTGFNPTWSTLTLSTASSLTWSTCYFTTYPIWSTLSLPYIIVYGFMDFRLWLHDNLFCYA